MRGFSDLLSAVFVAAVADDLVQVVSPANVLWSSGAMAGVVDWHKACIGPADVDVADCCVDLAMLYGPQAVDTFQKVYTASAPDPRFLHDPFWDLETLLEFALPEPGFYPPWIEYGIRRPRQQVWFDRCDEYLRSIMRRF